MSLRVSHPSKEGLYQASKWLKIQVLCSGEELALLFDRLSPFSIFPLTGVVDGKPLSPLFFLEEYSRWIEGLQRGSLPTDAEIRRLLACAFTKDESALWLQEVPKGYLVKISKPVVQVQAHFFTYSPLDGVFRPMSMGQDSIFWGLQFSFPQIYQNPETMELLEVEEGSLFRTIQLWAREETRATPFVVDGKRVNSPIRIGKKCLPWIGLHPGLMQRGIGIYAS